jgi:hypothetical protein
MGLPDKLKGLQESFLKLQESYLNFERREAQETIDLFCSYCDFKDQPDRFCKKDQPRYALRDYCGWSRVKGVNVEATTLDELVINGINYRRSDKNKIMEAIPSQKKKGDGFTLLK